jgi:poly(ADP-ribose) glycohydrolase ARH3
MRSYKSSSSRSFRPDAGVRHFRAAARRPAEGALDERTMERARGALLGTFVGDALGMPYEGARAGAVPRELEMVEARLGLGTYTDDTQMMIALAESLLRCDVVDPDDLARAFRAHYDPRRGYGAGTSRVLELWETGAGVDAAARQVFAGEGSLGNGAAMRVAPVAVRFFDDSVLLATQAARSARLTHAHPVGVDGAVVQAAAVAAALDDEPPLDAAIAAARTGELRDRLLTLKNSTASTISPEILGEPARRIGSSAPRSVPVAVVAAARAESFEEAVTLAIRCGGDTDTVGAMAGAIAGARFGVSAIPARWLDALEDGAHGRRHVDELARQLAARAGSAVSSGLGTEQR